MILLGVDFGGSGIKAAPVDVERGVLVAPRRRIPTPQPATPATVAAVIAELVRHFEWRGPLGCGMPAVIKDGVAQTAGNIDPAWIGLPVEDFLARAAGCPVAALHDADAALLGELRFGAARAERGVVLLLTLGTGIGSAAAVNRVLVANTAFGELEIRGKAAKLRASSRVREEQSLSWKRWAKRLDEFLARVERVFPADLIILGGGVSEEHGRFVPRLHTAARLVPAALRNDAGIVGAALTAARRMGLPDA